MVKSLLLRNNGTVSRTKASAFLVGIVILLSSYFDIGLTEDQATQIALVLLAAAQIFQRDTKDNEPKGE